ncbi:histone acetyltransferase MCC1-like isoform X3 [Phalaenopsis equestris]|uniref:histone acetyltransferase MCC1-like isoform X3 n=1 Tax=Phalaenopsis equestris TaxID=78828 RepID=UPI0009E599ED|nr:histone acetyltransferase MCC1-like isoform X3 [Phalaenopsis equestris]
MFDFKIKHHPTIIYRPIRPSDLQVLELIHASLFPVRYDIDFFLNVVNGLGIVSWGAVDISRSDGRFDELIGFVTTRIISVKESEIENLLRYDMSRKDQTLVYILTLGVVEQYRNLGIASALVREVIKYASSISSCRAVYLHVIAYNQPAIHFYQKMLFKLVRREVLAAFSAYLRRLLSILAGKIWVKRKPRWPRCKENNILLVSQNKRILNTENSICQTA